MYKLEIVIPIHPTDSNKILGVNKYAKNEIFKRVKREVHVLVYNKKPPTPLTSFKISVIRHSVKTLDYDNFVASLKPFIDGLKLSGIIKDDSWQYIKHINIDQLKSEEKKLVITVEEIC